MEGYEGFFFLIQGYFVGHIFIFCSQEGKIWTPPDLADGHF